MCKAVRTGYSSEPFNLSMFAGLDSKLIKREFLVCMCLGVCFVYASIYLCKINQISAIILSFKPYIFIFNDLCRETRIGSRLYTAVK